MPQLMNIVLVNIIRLSAVVFAADSLPLPPPSPLQGVVKVGAVDADQHKSLGGQYQIQGFPTIKVFGANKQSPQDYRGGTA